MRNIIDGNSLLYRAYYGVHQRLTRPDGVPVNAVYGFCNMILPLIADMNPGDDFICVFDAHRRNWRNDIYPDYKAQRDETPADLVAQIELTRAAVRAMGMPCLVVGNVEADDVIATLAQERCPTRIISSDKDLMQLVNDCCFIFDTMKNQEYHEKEVIEKFGVKPSQMIDYQSLVGDSSDNVPGVHGIGPKKATELISEFGTLENIYANLANVRNDRVRTMLETGKEIAFISKKLVTLKTDVDVPVFERFNFNPQIAHQFFINEVNSPSLAEKVDKITRAAEQYDAEKEALDNPIIHHSQDIFVFNPDDFDGLFVQNVWDKLIDRDVKKIAWDWKTIFHKLDSNGFDVSKIEPIDDVMLMNYAINKTERSASIIEDYNYFMEHPAEIYKIDIDILRPLFQMEKNGVLIDTVKLKEISEKLHKNADDLQLRIWGLAGQEFNIASPKQLAEILFDKLQLPTDKHRSTDADKLGDLSADYEIAKLVLEWRTLAKLTGTYTDALPKSISSDGRIHTTYLQTSTNTGRLSSQNPNLQNIPIKSEQGSEIRKCFIPAPGNVLISADYSQIQLRLLAHIADVKSFKDAFSHGKDIHAETAERIFGICTPENRRIAKTINFSILYGVSAFGLAAQLGISQRDAAAIIENYMAGLPEVKKYIEDTKNFAIENGYIDTVMGRRIMFPDINNPRLRNYSLRAAVNAPVQGFEADIMRVALARLAELPIKMILQIHDEIVFECPREDAPHWAMEIKNIMEDVVKLTVPLIAGCDILDNWGK